MASDWILFMIELGLEKRPLDIIDRDHPKVKEKFLNSLDLWLCNKKDASWTDIVCALRGIKETVLAEQLEAKYCRSDQGRLNYLNMHMQWF